MPNLFGRVRSSTHYPALKFSNFAENNLPDPPDEIDFTIKAQKTCAQMFENDRLGCCTSSAKFRILGLTTGNAGDEVVGTNDQVIEVYSNDGGYVPGRPNTDNGCDMMTCLKSWVSKGVPLNSDHKIIGWLTIDPTNQKQAMQAVWLFENAYVAMELPDGYTNPMPQASGFVWDDTAGPPNPNQGHCIAFGGYSEANKGWIPLTWAMIGKSMTFAAGEKYLSNSGGGEFYVVITQDMVDKATQKAPNGFDWGSLKHYFNLLGNDSLPEEPLTWIV